MASTRGDFAAPGRITDLSQLDYFDRLAELSVAPDADPQALRAAADDDGVRVPDVVFNALLGVAQAPIGD